MNLFVNNSVFLILQYFFIYFYTSYLCVCVKEKEAGLREDQEGKEEEEKIKKNKKTSKRGYKRLHRAVC